MTSRLLASIRRSVERRAVRGGFWEIAEMLLRRTESVIWKLRGFVIVECFGDSHAGVFRTLNTVSGVPHHRFRGIVVDGATVFGLANPNSQTNALMKFRTWLQRSPSDSPIIFMLGEVDMGFLVWWRAQTLQLSATAIMHQAIERYQAFLSDVRVNHQELLVISAPLPTIGDNQEFGEIANKRREVRASQLDRTRLTMVFNSEMERWCQSKEISYLNMDTAALDPVTRLVRSELMNDDPLDHHYDSQAFARMLGQALSQHWRRRTTLSTQYMNAL